MSAVVDGPAAEDIASRVTGGEVVALASRATWLATESGGAGTVTTLGLQFGTAGVVTAGLVGVSGAVSVAGRGRASRGTGTSGGPRRGGLLGAARRVAIGILEAYSVGVVLVGGVAVPVPGRRPGSARWPAPPPETPRW